MVFLTSLFMERGYSPNLIGEGELSVQPYQSGHVDGFRQFSCVCLLADKTYRILDGTLKVGNNRGLCWDPDEGMT
jgi:hypothetical protein